MTAGTASSSRSFDVLLGDRRVVAVVRHSDPRVAHALCVGALDAGLGVAEVTCSVPEAPALIERLCGSGAGDVLIAAGARAVGIGSDFNSAWEVGGRAAVHRLATRLRTSLEPDAPTLRPSHRSTLDRTHSAEIRAYPARLTAARPCERRTVRLDQER